MSTNKQYDGFILNAIYQRALFVAELALYNYAFVLKERSLAAVASLMNAIEGLEDMPIEQQGYFIDVINSMCNLNFSANLVDAVQKRLWYIYSSSAQ